MIKAHFFSGSGNTFTIVDNRNTKIPYEFFSHNAAILTSKEVKTEGLIIMNSATNSDFSVWFFNPDGSSDMMCGNGGRCAIAFAIKYGFVSDYNPGSIIRFEMNERIYKGTMQNGLYSIIFENVSNTITQMNVPTSQGEISGSFISVGTPHFIIKVDNIEKIDVANLGKEIREHSLFNNSKGTNVDFYSIEAPDTLLLRTYERGVEAETGACGTGAISTAIVYNKLHRNNKTFPNKIRVIPTSKLTLYVLLTGKDATLTGDVEEFASIILNPPHLL